MARLVRKPLGYGNGGGDVGGTIITPEAIAIFARGVRRIDRLRRAGRNRWEDRPLLQVSRELAIALKPTPWRTCPLDTYRINEPESWMEGELAISAWRQSKALCDRLLELMHQAAPASKPAPEPPPASAPTA